MTEVLGPVACMVARGKWMPGIVSGLIVGLAGILAGPIGLWAIVPFVLGIALQALKTYGERLIRQQAVDALTEYKAVLDASLQPLAFALQLLASHTTKKDRGAELANVLRAVIHGALQLAGAGAGVRASLFHRIDDPENCDALVPHPSFSTGRGDKPVSTFIRGVGEGRAVWEAAERDEVTFYEDIEADPPEGMNLSRDRAYKTFITAPIRADGRLTGLLTINAPKPGDLKDDDVLMMRILATLAGLALQICDGVWPASGTT